MTSPTTDQPLEAEIGPTSVLSERFRRLGRGLKRVVASSLERGPLRSDLLASIALLVWPALSIRTLLLLGAATPVRVSDVRGYASDLAVAISFAALAFVRIPLLRRVLIALGFVVLAVVSVINFEHVRANGSSFDIAGIYLLADGTFFRGSVLGASTLTPFALVFIPALVAVVSYAQLKRRSGRRSCLAEFGLVLTLSVLFEAVIPVPIDRIRWRQQHPLVENAVRTWQRSVAADPSHRPGRSSLPPEYRHLQQQDLNGESVLAGRPPIKNVLLVMLESLSRGHIFNMREQQRGPGWLPNLADFANRHVDYTQSIALQRQTVRGEYTILCGALPNLALPALEMDIYSATPRSERAECLPGFLERNGVKTVYLQAAPITFMGKGEFLPKAGFSSILDNKWFSFAYAASDWGVDDRAFFEQAGDLIVRLQRESKPWFLSLLTVGTHHPYLVPPEWKGSSKVGAFEDSLLYLDAVLKNFFAMLERERVLDDTLVIVTGDESAGYIFDNEIAQMMSQHSIPLILAYPGQRPGRVEERFSHSDLALSIADALGMAHSSPFHGRSMFRRYAEGRRIAFGNSYLSKVGAIGPGDELLLCDRTLGECSGFQLGRQDLFLTDLAPRDIRSEEPASLKQVVQALDRDVPAEGKGPITLFNPGPVRMKPKAEEQQVFFGKYHEVQRPGRASMHLALGAKEGAAILHHDISMAGGIPLFDSSRLALLPGMKLDWRYDLEMRAPVQQLEFRLGVQNCAAAGGLIDVETAEVEIVEHPTSQAPPDSTAEPFEVVPRSFDVTLPDEIKTNLLEQPGLLGRAACVKDGANGSWRLEGCADETPIVGPHIPLPARALAKVHFTVRVEGGSAMAHVLMTAEDGKNTLGKSIPLPLSTGHTYELELKLRLSRSHSDVETRIVLEKTSGLSASIVAATLDISP